MVEGGVAISYDLQNQLHLALVYPLSLSEEEMNLHVTGFEQQYLIVTLTFTALI